jgi:hypothetical protein
MAATWEDMEQGTMLQCMPPFSAASTIQLCNLRIESVLILVQLLSDYECSAICRDAAVTAASLQTLQLYGELS